MQHNRQRTARTLRAKLLWAVNLTVGILMIAALALDYERDAAERVAGLQSTLAEEARVLIPAVRLLERQGIDAVQRHLDAVCAWMKAVHLPGHTIHVRLGGRDLWTHGEATAANLGVLMEHSDGVGPHPTDSAAQALVFGEATDRDLTIRVYESAGSTLAGVRGRAVSRLAVALLLGLVGAATASLIIVRLVDRPLRGLATELQRIARHDFGRSAPRLGSREFDALAIEIASMSASLGAAARERTHQLVVAQRIQEHLRPDLASLPGLDAAAVYEPAEQVGGDFYDAFPLADGRGVVVCIADVCGHGVPAAMGAAMLKTLVRTAAEREVDPGAMLAFVNERLHQVTLPEHFVTMFLGVIDPASGELFYANAGHETALIARAGGGLEPLAVSGTVLGVWLAEQWQTGRAELNPSDRLVLMTDGVAEARGHGNGAVGRARVRDTVSAAGAAAPAVLARTIADLAAALPFGGRREDDVTVVVVARRA